MVGTRKQNKTTHPAAPVMSKSAKIRAGIAPELSRSKKQTKDEQIRTLKARLDALENLDETATVSRDPLFTRDTSPPEDADPEHAASEAPTELDLDDFINIGGKRIPSSSDDPRALKRAKAYDSFNEIRPTVRNKPSGLVGNWPQVLTNAGVATQLRRPSLTPSASSMSSLSVTPPPPAPFWQLRPSHLTPPTPSFSATPPPQTPFWQQPQQSPLFDPTFSAQSAVAPFFGQHPFPYNLDAQNDQANDVSQQVFQPFPLDVVHTFTRKYKDMKSGRTVTPGLKDLPANIQSGFRKMFICHIMKLVFSSSLPWNNPTLLVYQEEFDHIYSPLHSLLHSDDAVVSPMNRELCVLRSQMGSEALTAVIQFLPIQYSNRMLGSKQKRAAYVNAQLESTQRPFIWESFRPGTIEIPRGEETFFDQKRRGPFQSIPVLHAFWVYFLSNGIQLPLPFSEDPGRPVGALALAAVAVERGYSQHRSGDYVSGGLEFSNSNWIRATNGYINKIDKLTDDDWDAIFIALHRSQDLRMHEAKVAAGVVPETYEPLLPADPPTPPPT